MDEFVTGQRVQHSVYGEVEIYGFVSVGDKIELNVVGDDMTELDPVQTVNATKVEFLTENGVKQTESLENFYTHIE